MKNFLRVLAIFFLACAIEPFAILMNKAGWITVPLELREPFALMAKLPTWDLVLGAVFYGALTYFTWKKARRIQGLNTKSKSWAKVLN